LPHRDMCEIISALTLHRLYRRTVDCYSARRYCVLVCYNTGSGSAPCHSRVQSVLGWHSLLYRVVPADFQVGSRSRRRHAAHRKRRSRGSIMMTRRSVDSPGTRNSRRRSSKTMKQSLLTWQRLRLRPCWTHSMTLSRLRNRAASSCFNTSRTREPVE